VTGMGFAKLQSNHYHQQTNTKSFLQAGRPSCCPTNSVKALKGKTRNSAIANEQHDAFRGQSRSPNMVPFHMLGMVSY